MTPQDPDFIRNIADKIEGKGASVTALRIRAIARRMEAALEETARAEAAEARVKRLEEALWRMLAHSCVADAGADMKDAEDHAAEREARAALEKGEK